MKYNGAKRFLATKGLICFLLLILSNLLNVSRASAQDKVRDSFGKVFLFDLVVTDKHSMVTEPVYVSVSDTAIYEIFDRLNDKQSRFHSVMPKSPIILGIKLNPNLTRYYSAAVQSISKEYQTFLIPDSSDAVLIAMGINKYNVNDYHYHVVENDSTELVPWSPIPKLDHKYGAKDAYGFLGRYNSPGKRIMIEVVNKKNYGIREGVIFDWRVSFKPIVDHIQLSVPGNYFNLAYKNLNHGYATRFDPATRIPLDLKFPQDSVYNITIRFKRQETLVHTAYLIKNLKGKIDTSRIGYVDQYGFLQLYSSSFSEPGHYELVVKQQQRVNIWDDAQMTRIPFDVIEPSLLLKDVVKQVMLYLPIIIMLITLAFVEYRLYIRRQLKREKQEHSLVQLKLKSIRSQLNPHFMFNALSSIQNLINKNEVLEANRYLSKFAGLTRKVLETSGEEMTSLHDELKLAEDYLQMEQLRFDFKFRFDVSEGLDTVNLDVPAMLLQPIMENAVKHGIAALKEEGLIVVSATARGNDLVLSVQDNGKGFNRNGPTAKAGFGLKLSEERIDLLKQAYKGQSAKLNIDSFEEGTLVTITLTNWI